MTAGLAFSACVPPCANWVRPSEEANGSLDGNERLALIFTASGFYLFKRALLQGFRMAWQQLVAGYIKAGVYHCAVKDFSSSKSDVE